MEIIYKEEAYQIIGIEVVVCHYPIEIFTNLLSTYRSIVLNLQEKP